MERLIRKHLALDAMAWLVFGLGMLKMCWVVLGEPVYGYANSYDYVRQSACFGLWQFVEGVPKYAGSYLSTSARLLYDGETLPATCLFSSDNLFPWFASAWHSPGDFLSWAWIAVPKVALLGMLAVLLLARMPAVLRFWSALLFALVFGDMAYLGYVNTLYTDFSVISAGVLAVLAMVSRFAQPGRRDLPTQVILLLALVWLGLSKLQYVFLASFLACFYGMWLCSQRAKPVLVAALFGLALALPAGYLYLNQSSNQLLAGYRVANRVDTVFGAVLPAAPEPERALRILNLPPNCGALSGKTWYSFEGVQEKPCPEIMNATFPRLIRLFLEQPATFFHPLAEGLRQARPLYPTYLANTQGRAGFVEDDHRLVRQTSFTTHLASLPLALFRGLFLAGCAFGLAAAVALFLPRRIESLPSRETLRGLLGLAALGGSLSLYALLSSVFGDGYIEVQKHTVLFGIGLCMQGIAGLAGLCLMGERFRARSRPV
ncbi:hypothetical protein [Pseudomonas sp. RIT-PI-AD]|uniref:glycan biosynthesis hexose transferase WsfD n=1 Tax=Pseudomonas sp. RIT-PI-AD TaxID=3035294 RepID=UPI0021D903BF|nr:hypothetical protein [Pseudomonas sp. RIT-PI-AD]